MSLEGPGLRTVLDHRIPPEVDSDGADILCPGLLPTSHSITDSGPYARTKDAVSCADASGDGLPLLHHCTSGKDRTGWAACLDPVDRHRPAFPAAAHGTEEP
ncbi:tyrosine-protein phosphatase [Streptomyces rubradiris]|uniref:Tyrosine phosphatase family protein n=1 Tax=Streptomyces rubradiris TaxID=285531 RepID=A0ABQ3R356_STRRR|nr:tyrosine-protein phosphatase [Streptomyces rubradiris]GHH01414.1 hypothetical protein GCM10018792_16740 [Streptomyces rubradiris]GHI50283.1 hypothetical protein Srubr_01290 [Streptomyces rubradiris]